MENLEKALLDGFDEFGIEVAKNSAELMKTSASLCQKYAIEVDDFVDSWMAFAATKNYLILDEDKLLIFEREELSTRSKENAAKGIDEASIKEIKKMSIAPSRVEVFGSATVNLDSDAEMEADFDDPDNFLLNYAPDAKAFTPKAVKKQTTARIKAEVLSTPKTDFSPSTFSSAVKSVSYSARTKAGDSVLHFKCKDSEYWNEIPENNRPVKVFPAQVTKQYLESDQVFKYMFQKTTDMASTLNRRALIDIGFDILKEDEGFQDLRESSVGYYVGKIGSTEGRLTLGSIFLEGDIDISGGHIVPLDISAVEEYRLISGQVVVIRGENELGKCLRVSEILSPAPLPMPTILSQAARPLNIIIACGPYTTTDSLLYEPLKDLIDVIKRDKPDVCILMGPFIDPSHPMIVGGELSETFEEFFEKIVANLRHSLEDLKTHLVLVANHKDAHHHVVFPTPKYSIKYVNKITVLPDPSVIEVGGITIGLTSTDVLLHLAGNEIAQSTVSDRMGGLSRHILSQRNFYPLYPPDESVPFDIQLWSKFCRFTETPHILVLPSDLRCFIKEVDRTIVVNPEKLTKFRSGGTYARLQVKIPESAEDGNSVADFCCGEILKI